MAQDKNGAKNLEKQIKKFENLKNETGDPVLRIIYATMINANTRKYNTQLYTKLCMTHQKIRAIEEGYGRVDRENDRILKGNPALQSLIEAFWIGEMSCDGIIAASKYIDFHPIKGEIQTYKIHGEKSIAA